MNKLRYSILTITFVILLSLSNTSTASHILGAFITYNALSNTQYEVKVILYSDCSGISAPDSVTICLQSGSLGINDSFHVGHSVLPQILPPLTYYPAGTPSCFGGTQFGVEKHTYSRILDLSTQTDDWIVSFTTPFYVNSIPVPFPTYHDWGLFVSTKIDNLNYPGNSGVDILNDPKFLYCINYQNWEQLNGFDPDGDSLIFEFTDVLLDTNICAAQPFVNSSPFIDFEPVTSLVPYYIDPNLGWYSFQPGFLEIGYITIKISEIRNGLVINETTFSNCQKSINTCINTSLENGKVHNMKIYPTITTGNLNFEINPEIQNVVVEISDIIGKLVFTKNMDVSNSFNLNIEEINSGIYILKVISKSNINSITSERINSLRILKY